MLQISSYKIYVVIGFLLITTGFCYAQKDSLSGIKLINYYLTNNQISKAASAINSQIEYFENNNLYDSLYQYPYYLGKIEQKKSSTETAILKAEEFTYSILNNTSNNRTKYKTLLNLVDYYDEVGKNHQSIQTTKEALELVKKVEDATLDEIGKVQYNLGASYLSISDVDDATHYFRKALKNYEAAPTTSKKNLSDGYNAMGAVMWMATKLDSAKVYYQNAIESISENEGDSLENLYLATVIQSNISLLEYSQGNISNALLVQKEVIKNYGKVIQNSSDEFIKNKALRYQARALSNLAVFYNDVGNLLKAYEILKYSYTIKESFLEPTDRELATTLINIGEAELSLQEFEKAIKTIDRSLEKLNHSKGEKNYWKATALFTKAEANNALHQFTEAKKLYRESELLFEKALGENYDKAFLSFLQSKALFLSNSDEPKLAIKTAKKAYQYVINNTSEETNFQVFEHILTISKVYYNNNEFQLSKEWAIKGNQYLYSKISDSKTKLDSIRMEFERPSILLLEVKSNYNSIQKKDSIFLKQQLVKLQKAIEILEFRKTATLNIEDVNHLFSQYKEVYDFTKKMYLELYKLTGNNHYLDKTIGLHESAIYNRIRTRLNIRNNLSFKNVPSEILKTEKELKEKINNSLSNTEEGVVSIEGFFEATEKWNLFLVSLKNDYPDYYKMRYATIEEPLGDIQQSISENTTVIRYLFISENLYAYIIDKNKTSFLQLDYKLVENHINILGEKHSNFNKTSTLLFELYQQLWKPFEDAINTKKIIIIPDRELFNLSFETLTPTKIKSYNELSNNSLLAKYFISYNYSLFLLKQENTTINYKNNFVAFAPEFPDKMKQNYLQTISDSINLDKTYLNLLKQPFSVALIKKYSKEFDGTSFINEFSTKKTFKKNASDHTIIHIGTHAESNNITPELSRLIFAKDFSETSTIDDNSLFTYEIYDYNLNSNLTVLTACETGKPTYQSGEGMISLSHAFNYAGSESILTSLWKIDEQSSNQIIDLFYENISEGIPKDEALQKAKLSYINTAQGRTINPEYWAGLVLIGDTSSLEIATSNFSVIYWTLLVITFIILFILFQKRNKKSNNKT